jgi:hypothetical protein
MSAGCFTRLPSARPADFAFSYEQYGGMLPESTTLRCDARTCVYEHRHAAAGTPVQRAATPAQLDAIYDTFRVNRFDRIRMERHEAVSDRGTVGIRLRADGREYRVAPSATEDVSSLDTQQFARVEQAVQSMMASLFPSTAAPNPGALPQAP